MGMVHYPNLWWAGPSTDSGNWYSLSSSFPDWFLAKELEGGRVEKRGYKKGSGFLDKEFWSNNAAFYKLHNYKAPICARCRMAYALVYALRVLESKALSRIKFYSELFCCRVLAEPKLGFCIFIASTL